MGGGNLLGRRGGMASQNGVYPNVIDRPEIILALR